MALNSRQRESLRLIPVAVLLSALGGVFLCLLMGHLQARALLQFALTGAVISLPLAAFEARLFLPRVADALRRTAFLVHLLLKTAFYFLVIVLGIQLGRILVERPYPGFPLDGGFVSGVLFAVIFSIAVNFIFLVRRMVGTSALSNFFLGKYHHPREEQRIFMFLDVESSTVLAERIGHHQFHAFLNRFFFDISEPIRATNGSIYQYAGDGVVITWLLSTGVRDAKCLRCYFAIGDQLAAARSAYMRDFGTSPAFRAGLHAGPVVAGEIGDLKQEIVFLGDTVNTAARVLEACKTVGQRILVSRDLVAHLSLPSDISVRSLGPIALRGKREPIEIFTVERYPIP
jgi:adenylate cyclase